MKTSKLFVILIALLFVCINANAQLVGQFYVGQDGHVYFQARNSTPYNLSVTIVATSTDRENYENTIVERGFYLGPSTPWKWYWKEGDIITVKYPDGSSVYWKCPLTDAAYGSLTFKGKRCTYTVGCDCPGFSPITDGKEWEKSYCKRCGHPKSSHR